MHLMTVGGSSATPPRPFNPSLTAQQVARFFAFQHKRKQLIGQRRIVAERKCFEFSPIHAFDVGFRG
jgi:hypothetical protein